MMYFKIHSIRSSSGSNAIPRRASFPAGLEGDTLASGQGRLTGEFHVGGRERRQTQGACSFGQSTCLQGTVLHTLARPRSNSGGGVKYNR